MIHGTNKGLLAPLLAFAPAAIVGTVGHGPMRTAIAILGGKAVLAG
jgi:acetoacetate decarboxylase